MSKYDIPNGPSAQKGADHCTFGGWSVKKVYILLGLIFLIAVILRVINNTPAFFSYWYDESEYSLRAMHIVDSGGGYDPYFLRDHPPLFPYMAAVPFSMFGPHWYVGRGFVIFLSLINIYVFFLIGREIQNDRLGLFLALLFAISPLTVFVNREVTLDTMTVLFLSAAFLFVLRYQKEEKGYQFLAIGLFFALSCLTKEVAFVWLLPLAVFLIYQKLWRRGHFYLGLLLFTIIVVPVYYWMGQNGFFSFHTAQVTEGSLNSMGGTTFVSDRATSLLTSIGWINIGLAPVVALIYKKYKEEPKGLKRKVSRTHLFLLFWLIAGIILSLSVTLMGPHYDYYLFIPFIIIMGWAMYELRKKRWFLPVLATYLVISVCGIGYFYQLKGSNKAVEYLEGELSGDDELLTSDIPIFKYYFPRNFAGKVTKESVLGYDGAYIVFKASDRNRLLEDDAVRRKMEEYHLVFQSDVVGWDVEYYVYERGAGGS